MKVHSTLERRRIARLFFALIVLLPIICASYFYTRAVIRYRIIETTRLLAQKGWTVTSQTGPRFNPSLFGAAAILRDLTANDRLGNHLKASRAVVKVRLFGNPQVNIDDIEFKTKFGVSGDMPTLSLALTKQDRVQFSTPGIFLIAFKMHGGSRFHFEEASGVFKWHPASIARPARLGLQGNAAKMQSQAAGPTSSDVISVLSETGLSHLTIAAALELPVDQSDVKARSPQIFVQNFSGRCGALALQLAGKISTTGDGHMTIQASGVRAAMQDLQTSAFKVSNRPTIDNLRVIAQHLQRHLPNALTIPIEIRNWRVVRPDFDALLALPPTTLGKRNNGV